MGFSVEFQMENFLLVHNFCSPLEYRCLSFGMGMGMGIGSLRLSLT